jgi:ATP-dependent helicase/nuclease subunit B
MMQMEMVAREIRRMLDRDGYRPGDIGLLARSVADIAPVLKAVFARYDIPVWLHAGERLGENPFVRCVSWLLRLWQRDWRREDLLRFARSSYAGFHRFAVDAMERKARRRARRRSMVSRWGNRWPRWG